MYVTSRLPRLGLLTVLLCSCAISSPAQKQDADRDHPYQRQQWFMRGRTVNGRPGAKELHQAYQQKMANRKLRATLSGAKTAAKSAQSGAAAVQSISNTTIPYGSVWTPLGPAPAATSSDNVQDYGPAVGRITSVVVDQGDTSGNTVYIGGASGGVWKSTNAAAPGRTCNPSTGACSATTVNWAPLTDSQVTLAVGAIEIGRASCRERV